MHLLTLNEINPEQYVNALHWQETYGMEEILPNVLQIDWDQFGMIVALMSSCNKETIGTIDTVHSVHLTNE